MRQNQEQARPAREDIPQNNWTTKTMTNDASSSANPGEGRSAADGGASNQGGETAEEAAAVQLNLWQQESGALTTPGENEGESGAQPTPPAEGNLLRDESGEAAPDAGVAASGRQETEPFPSTGEPGTGERGAAANTDTAWRSPGLPGWGPEKRDKAHWERSQGNRPILSEDGHSVLDRRGPNGEESGEFAPRNNWSERPARPEGASLRDGTLSRDAMWAWRVWQADGVTHADWVPRPAPPEKLAARQRSADGFWAWEWGDNPQNQWEGAYWTPYMRNQVYVMTHRTEGDAQPTFYAGITSGRDSPKQNVYDRFYNHNTEDRTRAQIEQTPYTERAMLYKFDNVSELSADGQRVHDMRGPNGEESGAFEPRNNWSERPVAPALPTRPEGGRSLEALTRELNATLSPDGMWQLRIEYAREEQTGTRGLVGNWYPRPLPPAHPEVAQFSANDKWVWLPGPAPHWEPMRREVHNLTSMRKSIDQPSPWERSVVIMASMSRAEVMALEQLQQAALGATGMKAQENQRFMRVQDDPTATEGNFWPGDMRAVREFIMLPAEAREWMAAHPEAPVPPGVRAWADNPDSGPGPQFWGYFRQWLQQEPEQPAGLRGAALKAAANTSFAWRQALYTDAKIWGPSVFDESLQGG